MKRPAGGIFRLARPAIAAIACAFAACTPESTLPNAGEIRLEFVRYDDNVLRFRLANQSDRLIEFRGSSDDSEAHAWDRYVECRPNKSGSWAESPFTLIDGVDSRVRLLPGRQIDVVVERGILPPPILELAAGGQCRFFLMLDDRTKIGSEEFDLPRAQP